MNGWLVGVAVIGICVALLWLLPVVKRWRRASRLAAAKAKFHLRREWLEARFETLASQSGKPRGLTWSGVEFEDDASFAKDRNSGHLRALVGITVSFEAVEGGGMEDNPNVGNLRAGTAVFYYDGKQWSADGRPLFNVNPRQAIEHYRHELEVFD